jgi:hypothetical protein
MSVRRNRNTTECTNNMLDLSALIVIQRFLVLLSEKG